MASAARGGGGGDASADTPQTTTLQMVELCLRFSVIPLAVASLSVMATDRQIAGDYGRMVYSDFSGFRYLVSVDAISACYALLAILISSFKTHPGEWFFYVSDQAMAYLMVTAGSAAADVVYLAYEGNREVAWSEGCTYYGGFCGRAKAALVLHFAAFVCFVALAVVSACRAFSKFDAPSLAPREEEGTRIGDHTLVAL